MTFNYKKLLFINLFLFSLTTFPHGSHGGGDVSVEDIFMTPWHLHLPVEIGLDGSVHFGFSHSDHDHGEDDHDHGEDNHDQDDFDHDHGDEHNDHDDHEGDHDDHDDHDDHEGDHDDHDDHDDHEDKHENKWSIHPSIIFGGDRISRVVALDKVETQPQGFDWNISSPNSSKGFLAIRNTKLTGGLGLDLGYHLPISGGVIGLGLSLLRGTNKYSEQYISDIQKLDQLPSLKAPKNLQDLEKWSIGDRLAFGVTGGITTMGLFGLEPFLHMGPLYHVGGSWMIKMKKTDHSTVEVRMINNKVKALAVETDGIFVSAEVEKFSGQEKFMSFAFDLSSPAAEEALKELYRGRLNYAQKLLLNENAGVKRLLSGEGLSSGTVKIVKMSLPFFFGASKAKGRLTSYNNEENYQETSKTKVYSSSVTINTTTRGILSKHKMALKNFYANYADEWHIDHPHVSFGGTFKWLYEKDKVKSKTAKNKLKKLSVLTGIEKIGSLKFPKKKLGYFRVEFDAQISNIDTMKIMGLPKKLQPSIRENFENFKATSNLLIDEYFKTRSSKELCPILSARKCKEKMKEKTSKALAKLMNLSQEMAIKFQNKEYKEWTRTYAKWGSHLISNQFVFKSILSQLQFTKLSLAVKGEKVVDQKITLNF